MNRTLRLAVSVMIAAAASAVLAMMLGGGSGGSSLPYGCDYYSTPTIATQEIDSAGVLISSIPTSMTTTVTTPPTSSPSDVPIILGGDDMTSPPAPTTAPPTDSTAGTDQTTAAQPQQGDQQLGSLTVTHEKANVRSEPGAANELMKTAYNGESYEVLGTKNADNGIMWFKIKLDDGRAGYICSAFVRFDGVIPGAVVYLTFDDGPTENTPKILDILDRYGVKATFFVIYHSGQDSTYKDIVNRGHTLALHSYTHDYATIYKSQEAYFNDLNKLSDYVEKVTGVKSMYIRFPGGSSNTVSRKYCKGIMTTLTAEVERRGYAYFDWNVDSGDASGYRVKKSTLVDNISRRVSAGGEQMVLMHDAAAKTTTVEALPEIIEMYKNHGFDFRRITDDTPAVHQQVAN